MKLYKKYIVLLYLVLLNTTALAAQTYESSIIALDSIIINKNPSLILSFNLNSKELNKKGIDLTAKYHDTRDADKYSLFNIPVKSIEVILVDNTLISLEIRLEENNKRIESIEKMFVKHLGDFNTTRSKTIGSQRELIFGTEKDYFIIDAITSSNSNMGHLSVGYITKQFIELNKKMKQSN